MFGTSYRVLLARLISNFLYAHELQLTSSHVEGTVFGGHFHYLGGHTHISFFFHPACPCSLQTSKSNPICSCGDFFSFFFPFFIVSLSKAVLGYFCLGLISDVSLVEVIENLVNLLSQPTTETYQNQVYVSCPLVCFTRVLFEQEHV